MQLAVDVDITRSKLEELTERLVALSMDTFHSMAATHNGCQFAHGLNLCYNSNSHSHCLAGLVAQQPNMLHHPVHVSAAAVRRLCQELGWPLIDKDDARDCLQTFPAEVLQVVDANQLSYDIMFKYCHTQLSLGLSAVVDCPFARAELYDEAARIAQQVNQQKATLLLVVAVIESKISLPPNTAHTPGIFCNSMHDHCGAAHGLPAVLQCSAVVAVVDCIVGDSQLWQQRLEVRAQQQAGTSTCHKPQSWQQIQQLLQR